MEENKLGNLKEASPLELARAAVRVLDERKAGEIKLLKVADQTIIADYFVICRGNSSTQVKGLADEIEYKFSLADVVPAHVEGRNEGNWILLDYSSVLIHVFDPESRKFYNLEKLWSDAEDIDISDILTEN